MGCGGQCQQGRRPCPTPQACQLPEEDPKQGKYLTVALVLIALISFLIIVQ